MSGAVTNTIVVSGGTTTTLGAPTAPVIAPTVTGAAPVSTTLGVTGASTLAGTSVTTLP